MCQVEDLTSLNVQVGTKLRHKGEQLLENIFVKSLDLITGHDLQDMISQKLQAITCIVDCRNGILQGSDCFLAFLSNSSIIIIRLPAGGVARWAVEDVHGGVAEFFVEPGLEHAGVDLHVVAEDVEIDAVGQKVVSAGLASHLMKVLVVDVQGLEQQTDDEGIVEVGIEGQVDDILETLLFELSVS